MSKFPDVLSKKLQEHVPNAVKEHEPMVVAHFSKYELLKMDQMQGGTSIDEATGLREYSQLGDLLDNPEYRDAMEEILMDVKENHPLPRVIEKNAKNVIADPRRFKANPVDHDPEIHQIEQEGEGDDDELALIPIKVGKFLDQLNDGKPSINPHTGLRQYFLPFVAPFLAAAAGVGSTLAGKLAIGAGIGAIANSLRDEDPLEGALMGGVGGGIGHFAGPMIGGALGTLGSAFGGGQEAAQAYGPQHQYGPQPQGANAQSMNNPASSDSGWFGNDTFMGKMMQPGNLLPALAIGGLYLKGHKHSKQLEAEGRERDRKAREAINKYYGMDEGLGKIKPYRPQYTPDFRPSYEQTGGSEHQHFDHSRLGMYKKGGYVDHNVKVNSEKPNVPDKITPGENILMRGPGKGQDDLIKTQSLEGDFIVDATSTANLGDGYTDAGSKEIDNFLHKLDSHPELRKYSGKLNSLYHHKKPVPVALSPGEKKIDTKYVTLLGLITAKKGSDNFNKKGGVILQNAINKLRKHKTQNRTTIPPKAKPFVEYFSNEIRRKING